MKKGKIICGVVLLLAAAVLFPVTAFSASLTISPSTAVPGAALKFTASDDTAGTRIMVKQTDGPWTSEGIIFGSGVVTFNSVFVVPAGAAQGTKFCFLLVRTAIPQRPLPAPVQIAGPVCRSVIQTVKVPRGDIQGPVQIKPIPQKVQ